MFFTTLASGRRSNGRVRKCRSITAANGLVVVLHSSGVMFYCVRLELVFLSFFPSSLFSYSNYLFLYLNSSFLSTWLKNGSIVLKYVFKVFFATPATGRRSNGRARKYRDKTARHTVLLSCVQRVSCFRAFCRSLFFRSRFFPPRCLILFNTL